MSWTMKRTASDGTVGFQAIYRDPSGKKRSAGTFPSRREATAEGRRAESRVESGVWIDRTSGRTTFNDYVEKVWWPSRQLEVSTRAGYRSYLDKHFLPFFGDIPMAEILPSTVQAWITKAMASGLAPRSVVKYHVMLHGIFKRAVRDRVIAYNPCADSELPKVITKKPRILAPDEFERLLACIPTRFAALVLTEIETGLRWGELIALRPRHIDFLRRSITVEETIVEVSKKLSPTGERMMEPDPVVRTPVLRRDLSRRGVHQCLPHTRRSSGAARSSLLGCGRSRSRRSPRTSGSARAACGTG